MRTRELSLIAIFVSLMCIGSQITIPLGPIPFTLQLLFVFLTGFLFPPRTAFAIQVIYLLLGVIGLPVFAGFSGGIVHILGPSGGFLVSFPLAAVCISFLEFKKGFSDLLSGFLGLCIVYSTGWIWLGIYMESLLLSFKVGILPFILFDLIKLIISIYLKKLIESRLKLIPPF
ncbi:MULTISPECIES: biotin transporter BioY [Petrotoga]|uniref:Biotin transporter n=2 Tax=Petrotoga sibirica TaxID=156202 RepID=A0A4R8ESM5_9BACT|nr:MULTISPECIES: biotin transporter BioY [Petrotoga]KUK83871.1 MAG: BioY protein [Petrotoga mobilis]POZ89360.1 biotin transporter BioY [Petrotoga sibirica DSM 13575]POZ91721.1 biotin transporter BioY [Petrotoga sp. SL27]TDX15500.1 biotin transport system substrate-specific component [Petrotoga sibirica]